jgi:hypothetical protein
MRYYFAITPWLAPMLFVFGVRSSTSYVEIEGDELRVRYGSMMNRSFPLSAIRAVEEAAWPWYAGLGLRTNLTDTVAAVASYKGVVKLTLDPRQDIRVMLPTVACSILYFSLTEPAGFVKALSERIKRAA